MKIYTEVRISINSGEILSEKFYEYEGLVDLCCSSGGSSSGGSASGKVDYPAYMKDQHLTWLTDVAADITTARAGNSPYYSATSYNPATDLSNIDAAITAFNALVDALSHESDWESAMQQAETTIDALIDASYIDADVAAFAAIQDDQIYNVVLPKFQRGMQDINAVQTSSFVLGEALIYGMRDRDVAKYTSDLKLKLNIQRNELVASGASTMLQNLFSRVDFERVVAHYTLEANRMSIVSNVDYNKQDIELDELDARWDMNAFAFGSNVMSSIAGSATNQGTPQKSQIASALGGALSGAAAGAKVGGGYGAIIGGVLGAASSYL